MCGLAGFARHPEGQTLELSKVLLCDSLSSIEGRGRHATGIAACGGTNPFIWKWAEPASKVLASDVWKETLEAIHQDTPILIGHTRHATHHNAHLDAAAHPFKEGRVVGAHNGVIYNWMSIAAHFKRDTGDDRLIVDSQAAFLLLDKAKKPEAALRELKGYFALTWVKGKYLFMARSQGAPLTVAYHRKTRTVYWNSERTNLEKLFLMHDIGKDEVTFWEPTVGKVYRFDPTAFDEHKTNVESWEGGFGQEALGRRTFNSAQPEMMGGSAAKQTNMFPDSRAGSISGAEAVGAYSGGSKWDSVSGREVFPRDSKPTQRDRARSKKGVSVLDLDREVEGFYDAMGSLTKQLRAVRADNATMDELLNAAEDRILNLETMICSLVDILVDNESISEEQAIELLDAHFVTTSQKVIEAQIDESTEEDDDLPFRDGQLDRLCEECGEPVALENAVVGPKGGACHPKCLFAETVRGAIA